MPSIGTERYDALVERLYAQNELVIKYDLDAMRRACAILGLERPAPRGMLVGGTNGKGTTSATLHAMLHAAGLRVGLFTSPHLVDFRERMRIDGVPISRDEVLELLPPLLDQFGLPSAADAIGRPLSFFELTTLLACVWFARQKVDVAILEVGMGGRLDATNVFEPDISILTSVSLDHMAWLGDTTDAIAREKAAIARPGRPVIIHGRAGGAAELKRALSERNVTPIEVRGGRDARGWNRALAASAARTLLPSLGFAPAAVRSAIRRGRQRVRWPARQQTLRRQGRTWWIDGAHNPASTVACAAWLASMARKGAAPAYAIVGATPGRDLHETFGPLATSLRSCRRVFVVPASEHRSVSPEELEQVLTGDLHLRNVTMTPALQQALALCDVGPVLVAGSLYLCGAVLDTLGFDADSLPVLSGQVKRSANSR